MLLFFGLRFISYQVLQVVALPFVIFFIAWRKWKGKKTFGTPAHRFGWVPRNTGKASIWIQAVSVGETLASEYFIEKLAADGQSVYLTSGTAGAVQVSKNFRTTHRAYLPFDFLPCIILAFWRIKPKALIIIEGDWWPNLVMVARILNIPVYGINARVTQHSGLRSLMFKIICWGVIRNCTQLFVQTEADAQTFADNGISTKKIYTLGNIKAFNVAAKLKTLNLQKKVQPFPVLMAGSIHPGEADIFLGCFGALKRQFPTLRLIVVPRHLHWLDELTKEAWDHGNVFVLRNKPDASFAKTLADHDIIIGGTLGIMFELYAYASLFYLGGTFVPVGGHNLLEPAVWGIASIVGPNHVNCVDTLQYLQQHGAGFVAKNGATLLEQSAKLFSDQTYLATAGAAAARWLEEDAQRCEIALRQFRTTLK